MGWRRWTEAHGDRVPAACALQSSVASTPGFAFAVFVGARTRPVPSSRTTPHKNHSAGPHKVGIGARCRFPAGGYCLRVHDRDSAVLPRPGATPMRHFLLGAMPGAGAHGRRLDALHAATAPEKCFDTVGRQPATSPDAPHTSTSARSRSDLDHRTSRCGPRLDSGRRRNTESSRAYQPRTAQGMDATDRSSDTTHDAVSRRVGSGAGPGRIA